jgi:hypothetical protein
MFLVTRMTSAGLPAMGGPRAALPTVRRKAAVPTRDEVRHNGCTG